MTDMEIIAELAEHRTLGISRRIRIANTLRQMNYLESSEHVRDLIERAEMTNPAPEPDPYW